MFKLTNNYKDMLQTLTQDIAKAYPWAIKQMNEMSRGRCCNRPLPYYEKRYATIKQTGDKWNFMAVIRNKAEMLNVKSLLYLPYGSGAKSGVVLFKKVPTEMRTGDAFAFVNFLPHCVERYRQRQLTEHNINVPKAEQIDLLLKSMYPGGAAFDGGLIIFMTQEGAFMGQLINETYWQMNTFIAYKDAYKNQRKVLDEAKAHIAELNEDINNNAERIDPNKVDRSNGNPDAGKEAIRGFIRKSGQYYEQAHKKQQEYDSQEVTMEKTIDLSNL